MAADPPRGTTPTTPAPGSTPAPAVRGRSGSGRWPASTSTSARPGSSSPLLIAVMAAPAIEEAHPGSAPAPTSRGWPTPSCSTCRCCCTRCRTRSSPSGSACRVRSISLHFLGGATEIDGEPETPGHEFWVAVVGPLTSLGVGVAALALSLVTPGGLIGFAVSGARVGEPRHRRHQPASRPAAGRRPGPAGGGVARGRSPAPLARRRRLGRARAGGRCSWGGRCCRPRCAARAPEVIDYVLAFVVAAFLWAGGARRCCGPGPRSR